MTDQSRPPVGIANDRRRPSKLIAVVATLLFSSTIALPTGVVGALAQESWHYNDEPILGGSAWLGGDPVDSNKGYGPARYFGNSNYAYTSAVGGRDPSGHWARWEMGTRVGTQQIQVFIPCQHATANVVYQVRIQTGRNTTSVEYSQRVEQAASTTDCSTSEAWHTLKPFREADGSNWTTNGNSVEIEVFYDESRTATGKNGAFWRGVGVDALRMRCVEDCDGRPETSDPRPVRNLAADAHGTGLLRVTWSPPSDSGSSSIKHYRVVYSRPPIGNLSEWESGAHIVTRTSHTTEERHLVSGRTYTVTVTAVNQDNKTSTAASVRATTNTSTEAPGPVRSLDADARGANQLRVTWSPPSDSGSSSIKHYRVVYSRPPIGNLSEWESGAHIVTGTSHTTEDGFLISGRTYTVAVTAVNRDNLQSSPTTTTGRTGPRPSTDSSGCPLAGKFEVKREGWWPFQHNRIYALKGFAAVDGDGRRRQIDPGDKGGEVSSESNLSQSGCAWIFLGAKVRDGATVSGNATVSGDAVVSGTAEITGEARIIRNMLISAGTYDGNIEYRRSAQELYDGYLELIVDTLDCIGRDEAERLARRTLAGTLSSHERQLSEAIQYGCARLDLYRSIVESFTGGDDILVSAASLALPILGTLKLGSTALNFVKLANAGLDVYQTGSAAIWSARTLAEFERIAR